MRMLKVNVLKYQYNAFIISYTADPWTTLGVRGTYTLYSQKSKFCEKPIKTHFVCYILYS